MDLTKIILKRRSIRRFTDKPIELATIGGILEIAKEAPSSGNIQNWRLIIVTEKKIRAEIVNACLGQNWLHTAPAIIVVCADVNLTKKYKKKSDLCSIQNTSIIATYIMLKAAEVGLGTCWVDGFDDSRISSILRLPANIKPYALLPIGHPHPDEKYRSHKRIPINNLTWFNRYGYAFNTAPRMKKPSIVKRIKSLIRK